MKLKSHRYPLTHLSVVWWHFISWRHLPRHATEINSDVTNHNVRQWKLLIYARHTHPMKCYQMSYLNRNNEWIQMNCYLFDTWMHRKEENFLATCFGKCFNGNNIYFIKLSQGTFGKISKVGIIHESYERVHKVEIGMVKLQ